MIDGIYAAILYSLRLQDRKQFKRYFRRFLNDISNGSIMRTTPILFYKRLIADKLFWFLTLFFIGIPLAHFSYIPIWDGWQFSKCYLIAAQTGSLSCFCHSSFLDIFLFSLTQRVALGDFQLVYTVNILLGILAIFSLRALLKYLFDEHLSPVNLTLLAFCFGLNPIFLAHTIQPCLDFSLTVFFIMLLASLFKNFYWRSIIIGTMLVFTKEPGFMLYCVSIFLYIAIKVMTESSRQEYKKSLSIGRIGLVIPILLFVIYMLRVPETQTGTSWNTPWIDVIIKMFKFDWDWRFVAAQFISVFIINFNWLMTSFVVINLFHQIYVHSRHSIGQAFGFQRKYEKAYFLCLIILIGYFLTRIPFVHNPRYVLSITPLLVILFAESLSELLKKQSLITWALGLMLVLLLFSSLWTIDPIAKKVMGTFKFGRRDILWMTNLEDSTLCGYGRDQLVYNFQFTQFDFLTEKMLNVIGWDKIYIIAPQFTFTDDFTKFDITTKHRAIYGDRLRSLSFLTSSQILKKRGGLKEVYYVAYPNMDKDGINRTEMAKLLRIFTLKEVIRIADKGYAIDIFHFVIPGT